MGKRTVKRIVFHAVARALRETQRTQADIAADYSISPSTVSSINNAGTWGNYLAGVRAKKQLRAPVGTAQPSKEKAPTKVLLRPVSAEERRKEEELAAGLDKLNALPDAETLARRFNNIHDRQDVVLERVRDNEKAVKILTATIVIVAVVLFVITVLN